MNQLIDHVTVRVPEGEFEAGELSDLLASIQSVSRRVSLEHRPRSHGFTDLGVTLLIKVVLAAPELAEHVQTALGPALQGAIGGVLSRTTLAAIDRIRQRRKVEVDIECRVGGARVVYVVPANMSINRATEIISGHAITAGTESSLVMLRPDGSLQAKPLSRAKKHSTPS